MCLNQCEHYGDFIYCTLLPSPIHSTDLLFADLHFVGHFGGLLWLLSDDILHLQWGLAGQGLPRPCWPHLSSQQRHILILPE